MLTCKCLKKRILNCGNKSLKANFNLMFYVKDLKSHTVAQVVYALFTHKEKNGKRCAKLQTGDCTVYIFTSISTFGCEYLGELVPVNLLETFQ